MHRAAQCLTHNQAVGEVSAVVGAVRTDRKQRSAFAYQQDFVLIDPAADDAAVGDVVNADSGGEIRAIVCVVHV